jgi:formylglycine-generating enzyme
MKTFATAFFFLLFDFSLAGQKIGKGKAYPRLPEAWKKHYSFIPPRTITVLSYTGSDSASFYTARKGMAGGFYIRRTEVTNREYRAFVHYVRDSIAHVLLGHLADQLLIDWHRPIDWKDQRLEKLIVKEEGRVTVKKEIAPEQIVFKVDLIDRSEIISVYPDTLVWIRDYNFSHNEPLAKKYFSKAEYDDHPVVGVNLKQAIAYCQWKTIQLQKQLGSDGTIKIQARLPTNTEWESAAFVLKDSLILETGKKDYHYNFGNILDTKRSVIKSYKDDGFLYTSPVKSYRPGPFGLYDMKGNISEWTSSTLEEITNVEIKEEKKNSLFVVKGGGWNSAPFYLQAGVCQFLKAEETHSYVGFRYVVEIGEKD